tara:strand:- start:658 stop:1188 length:531 start_codon:yes stop_codon:yes gene_type:complete
MPNWCSNSLIIRGDVETLSQLKPVLEAGEGLLEAIKPIGEWEYGNAVEAWGTKWDVSTEGLQFVDHGDGTAEIEGYFDSAWSPPVEAFEQLAQDWDSCYIELKYFEPGMCFVGVFDSGGGASVGGCAHYDGIDDLLDTTAEEDSVLHELLEDFNVADWYDTDEEQYEDDLESTEKD